MITFTHYFYCQIFLPSLLSRNYVIMMSASFSSFAYLNASPVLPCRERLKEKQLQLSPRKQQQLLISKTGAVTAKNTIIKHTVEVTREQQQLLMQQRQQHFAQLKELMKQKVEQQKAERKQERDVKKKHVRLLALEVKEWQRPREDQICGGHKVSVWWRGRVL